MCLLEFNLILNLSPLWKFQHLTIVTGLQQFKLFECEYYEVVYGTNDYLLMYESMALMTGVRSKVVVRERLYQNCVCTYVCIRIMTVYVYAGNCVKLNTMSIDPQPIQNKLIFSYPMSF